MTGFIFLPVCCYFLRITLKGLFKFRENNAFGNASGDIPEKGDQPVPKTS
jgi:hypothetical protein